MLNPLNATIGQHDRRVNAKAAVTGCHTGSTAWHFDGMK